MVFMRMGAYNHVELGDAFIFKSAHQAVGSVVGPGIDQHIAAVDLYQNGISLADIQESNLKRVM